MIYLLHGEDTAKARGKLRALVEGLCAKKPDASFFEMDEDRFSAGRLEELIVSMGLFEQKYIVALDNIFQNKEAKEFVLKKIKEIEASENIFIFLEGKLDKKTVTKIEKHSEKVQEFAKKTEKNLPDHRREQKDFNIFSLTDAIGRRDRKKAWMLFQQAVAEGTSAENIHGTVFWGVKSMLLSLDVKTAKEAGLNPFVFSKAKRFSQNFKKGELENISSNLVSIYHEARRGGMGLAAALEVFVLSV